MKYDGHDIECSVEEFKDLMSVTRIKRKYKKKNGKAKPPAILDTSFLDEAPFVNTSLNLDEAPFVNTSLNLDEAPFDEDVTPDNTPYDGYNTPRYGWTPKQLDAVRDVYTNRKNYGKKGIHLKKSALNKLANNTKKTTKQITSRARVLGVTMYFKTEPEVSKSTGFFAKRFHCTSCGRIAKKKQYCSSCGKFNG